MIALPLGTARVDGALRVVRALGAHRYVAGCQHWVHALAVTALDAGPHDVTHETCAWARAILRDGTVDPASRDERLWRRVTDADLLAILAAYWTPGSAAPDSLRALLRDHALPLGEHAPFDENVERAIHPLAIDAGWQLLSLAELDPQSHKGAIAAFGDEAAFASARFEEENAIPASTHFCELPAIGPVELLRGAGADGGLVEQLVLWVEGDATYLDYVVRGVRRAAKTE
jgi:hypothetical protein